TREVGQASESFVITPLLSSGLAAVHHTGNPLIALFSAPACAAGNTMLVRFQKNGSNVSQTTDSRLCNGQTTMNWYVAGMYANSQYQRHFKPYHIGTLVGAGANLISTTGSLPLTITCPANPVLVPASSPNSTLYPLLLHDYLPRNQIGVV